MPANPRAWLVSTGRFKAIDAMRRRVARTSPSGDLVLLEDQDRSLWNREQIAAVHAEATHPAGTDWARIAGLYDRLVRADLCRRLGKRAEAKSSYERALTLARLDPERRFLERRMAELG